MAAPGRPRKYAPGERAELRVTISAELVTVVDDAATQTGRTRGEIVEQALAAYVASMKGAK